MTSFLLNQEEIQLVLNVRKLDTEKTAVLYHLARMYASTADLSRVAPNVIRLYAAPRKS